MRCYPVRLVTLLGLVLCALLLYACSKAVEPPIPAAGRQDSAAVVAPDPAAGQKRMMARNVEVQLRSKNPSAIVNQLTALAESHGGYVVQSEVRAAAPGELGAEVTLRLPVAQVEAALSLLRRTGEVRSETRKGDDVTSEVIDTEARLTARRALEKRLLELLASARSVEDMLKVENELARVRTEIEQLTGQARTLSQRTEMVELKVSIESPEAYRAQAQSFGVRFKEAWFSALETSETVVLGVIELLGALLPLGVLGLLVAWPVRVVRRRMKERRLAALQAPLLEDQAVPSPEK